MVVELRAKSQITIPSETVKSLGLKTGDQFEIVEKDGGIFLIPVVTYPKAYVEKLETEARKTADEIKSGERPVFDSVDAMMDSLEN